MSEASFKGNAEQQALAAEVYQLMITQGAMFALGAPIRQTLANLASYLAAQKQRDPESFAGILDEALTANAEVFLREESRGDVIFTTSRQGRYVPAKADNEHTFKQRLYEPEDPLPVDDISVVVSTSRPALTSVEPVFISDYWQIQAGLTPVMPGGEEGTEGVDTATEMPVDVEAEAVAEMPVDVEAEAVAEMPAETVAEMPTETEAGAVAEMPAETFEAESADSATAVPVADGLSIEFKKSVEAILAESGAELAALLHSRLDHDPLQRIASFGRHLYPMAAIASLGKNDMRRIREYILEVGEPLTDTTIIADLYFHNPRQTDYEGFRFSLNYRLNREKEFEFVGVNGAHLWATKGLPNIGGKRVKASEIGQLTSFITEGYDDSLANQSRETIQERGSVDRLLSFFEWEYGILPLDASLTALMPTPMLADQRSVVLRFESPQHYVNYLIEVRYPTGNRGGWLQGFEEFFHEHLVPGALITIARTDEPHVFVLSYEEGIEVEDRLLTLDEKKHRYAFANLDFDCAVDDDWLVSQQRFGRLKNLKALNMSDRRKSDVVLSHVFEVMGNPIGSRSEPQYQANLSDLLVAINVLRPMSMPYLKTLLEADPVYSPDPENDQNYIYTPVPGEAEEEDSEEDVMAFQSDDYDD
jgi:hypothetical protein